MKKENQEIRYENGCKLELKGFNNEELQGLTPPYIFVDEMTDIQITPSAQNSKNDE